jgi:cellulose synthase/poly-beta-1,6-N-acetylglucosamine synthase-like glycosyltransferase
MVIVVSFFLVVYLLLLVLLQAGWNRAIQSKLNGLVVPSPQVTVVVPVRNEAPSIVNLLHDLTRQTYDRLSIVVVDDHSTDETLSKAEEFARVHKRVSVIRSSGQGKKAALTTAIETSNSEIIITTDGDCRVGPRWVECLCRGFADSTAMVCGPVKILQDGFFSDLQAMEFLSLAGSAVALAGFGRPVFCNGANLAFRRETFLEIGGYSDSLHVASGDDVFLLQKIVNRGHSIRFIVDRDAIVSTAPIHTWSDFLNQRLRWAGKWRFAAVGLSQVLAIFVIGVQTAVLLLPVLVLLHWTDPITIALLSSVWLAKSWMECMFLWRVGRLMQTRWNWPGFVLLLLTYPFYSLGVGLISNFSKYRWKGRTHKSTNLEISERFWSRA